MSELRFPAQSSVIDILNRDPEFDFRTDRAYKISGKEVASFETVDVRWRGHKEKAKTLSVYATDSERTPKKANTTWLLYVSPDTGWLQGARRYQPELDDAESIATFGRENPHIELDDELESVLQSVRGLHEQHVVNPNSLSTRARKAMDGVMEGLIEVSQSVDQFMEKFR